MLKLYRFYDLLHKCAPVVLMGGSGAVYVGEVKGIPDGFDYCVVSDFYMDNDGSTVFILEV